MKLAGTKSTMSPTQAKASICEPMREDADLECRYLDHCKGGGPIWNIFYLHCRFPHRYPIYDQHAYRAMMYIQTGKIGKNLTEQSRQVVYESYKEYRRFVAELRYVPPYVCDGYDLRTIDRALYTFGRFLKKAKPFVSSS
jgi:hypothetical protein